MRDPRTTDHFGGRTGTAPARATAMSTHAQEGQR